VSGCTRADLERLSYALPLMVAQDDEAGVDALLAGLDLVELQALCTGVASLVVQSIEVMCETVGVPDPKAYTVEMLQRRALEAAAE
jgi:hypothetical protein